jgi:dinuclear metal center YbgI/SA1388 family protein
MPNLRDLAAFLDGHLAADADLDYPGAWNGLQVEGPGPVSRIAVAVDCSEAVIDLATQQRAQLLVVHHGLFWDPDRRITGPTYRKLSKLLASGLAIYASHLPLDRHAEFGNSAGLLRHLGLVPAAPFGLWKGAPVGWSAQTNLSIDDLLLRLKKTLPDAPLRSLQFGPSTLGKIACVTGSGADLMSDAAAQGIHTLITGEASHQHYNQARELGMNLILAGHYATETFGVRAIGTEIERVFGIPYVFIDDPSPF